MKIVSQQRGAACALVRRTFFVKDVTTGNEVKIGEGFEWDPDIRSGTAFTDEEVKTLVPMYGGAIQL